MPRAGTTGCLPLRHTGVEAWVGRAETWVGLRSRRLRTASATCRSDRVLPNQCEVARTGRQKHAADSPPWAGGQSLSHDLRTACGWEFRQGRGDRRSSFAKPRTAGPQKAPRMGGRGSPCSDPSEGFGWHSEFQCRRHIRPEPVQKMPPTNQTSKRWENQTRALRPVPTPQPEEGRPRTATQEHRSPARLRLRMSGCKTPSVHFLRHGGR